MGNRVSPGVTWLVDDSTGIVSGQRLADGREVLSGAAVSESVDSEAEMLALQAVVGSEVYRTDTGTWWKLHALPASSLSNWSTANYPTSSTAYAEQFLTTRRALPIRSVIVSATGSIADVCAIVGYRCVTPGSAGTLTVHDGTNASDATKLRETRAFGSAVANTYYPMAADDQCAMLFDTGCYVTNTTGGVYVFDVIDDVSAVTGYEGTGMLVTPVRAAATGQAIATPSSILSLKVIAPGSAGTLTIHDDTDAADATRLRLSIGFGSLAVGQLIQLGGKGGAPTFDAAYVTITTGGVFLLNQFPE